jgi:ribosomal protein S27AE
MERIRAYYDVDQEKNFSVPTHYQTKLNKNEIFCSLCGDRVFVDDFIFADVSRAIEKTSENPFLCEDCLDEYEEMAHQ